MNWYPHVTVATIVENDGRYLMVEEIKNGQKVFNQPAGHLEDNETLLEAAVRETLEETQWLVEITGVLGFTLYTSPANHTTYFRCSFKGRPVRKDESHPLDTDIERAVWMTREEIEANEKLLRSDMVLNDIHRYEHGELYPLSILSHI